jgi:hypothetical protein
MSIYVSIKDEKRYAVDELRDRSDPATKMRDYEERIKRLQRIAFRNNRNRLPNVEKKLKAKAKK